MDKLDDYIKANLDGEICPHCGKHAMLPGTMACDRFGVCETCYNKAKTEAMRDIQAAKDSMRERKATLRSLERSDCRND